MNNLQCKKASSLPPWLASIFYRKVNLKHIWEEVEVYTALHTTKYKCRLCGVEIVD